jgi:ribonuclease BN (tRNA processing enzyme)
LAVAKCPSPREGIDASGTKVTFTGTGVRYQLSGRPGAGTLVQHGETALQLEAGRATTLRLAEACLLPTALAAVFLTHIHNDHTESLPDLAMTRWIRRDMVQSGPLTVVCPHRDPEKLRCQDARALHA